MRQPCALLVLLALASACKNLQDQRREDQSALAQELRARAGVEPGEPGISDLSLTPVVEQLLGQEITEESAVRIALLNNRRVRIALEQLGLASADLIRAGLLPNPFFSVELERFDDGTEVDLRLAQPIFDLLFRSARLRQAEAKHRSSQASITSSLIAFVFDVRRAVVEVRASKALSELREQGHATSAAALELAQELHRAGNATDPELTQVELEASQGKLAWLSAQNSQAQAVEKLAALLGLSQGGSALQVAGVLDEQVGHNLDLAAAEERSLRASLEMEALRAQLALQAERVGLSSKEVWLGESQVGVAARREQNEREWGMGPALSLALPLWNQGTATRNAAQGQLSLLLAQGLALEVEIRSRARHLKLRLQGEIGELEILSASALPLAGRLVREVMRNYNAMQVGAFDVLRARRAELDLQVSHLERVRQAWLVRFELEELLCGHLRVKESQVVPQASDQNWMPAASKEH